MPADIFYCQAASKPLTLIECAYFEDVIGKIAMIEVVSVHHFLLTIELHHRFGVGVKKWAIAFEMDNAIGT